MRSLSSSASRDAARQSSPRKGAGHVARSRLMFKSQTWLVFLWAAAFAGAAALLEALLKHVRTDAPLTRRLWATLLLETLVVAFWGGLAGWTINALVPGVVQNHPDLLGVAAAVLGRGGLTVTRDAVARMTERALGVDLGAVGGGGRKK